MYFEGLGVLVSTGDIYSVQSKLDNSHYASEILSLLCVWQCVHRMQESMCEKIDRSCNVFIKIQNVFKKPQHVFLKYYTFNLCSSSV